jgi:hypothetical protein
MKKNAFGRARSTIPRGEVYTGIWWENLRKSDHLETPGVDGRVISKWTFRKWDGACTGLICLKTGAVRAVVYAVMNILVP